MCRCLCRLLCKATVGFVALCFALLFILPAPDRVQSFSGSYEEYQACQAAGTCHDSLPGVCLDESSPESATGTPHDPPGREFDIIVHGATGFTGELTVRYLANHSRRLSYAIAGRSQQKLDALAASIKDEGGRAPIAVIIADSMDKKALMIMAARGKVVLAAAGPYAKYGTDLLNACAEVGTHYADMSGETFWQRRMLDAAHETAIDSGAKLVIAAGFDSVPFDLGVQLVLKQLELATRGPFDKVGKRAQGDVSIIAAMLKGGGAMSGGTLGSAMGQMEELNSGKVPNGWDYDPYLLSPATHQSCKPDAKVTGWGPFPRWESRIGTFGIPHFMAPINARIVRRSLELTGRRGVSYAEGMTFGAIWDAIRFMVPFIVQGEMKLQPQPGEGPSLAIQMAGGYEAMFVALDAKGHRAEVRMKGHGDPGYRHTSKIFAEVGICLSEGSCHRKNSGGGLLTSMSALDRDLLEQKLRVAKHEDGSPLLTYTNHAYGKSEL